MRHPGGGLLALMLLTEACRTARVSRGGNSAEVAYLESPRDQLG